MRFALAISSAFLFAVLACAALAAPPVAAVNSDAASKAAYENAKGYQLGRGVRKNDKTAVEWYRKAGNYPPALAELGYMYSLGKGVPQNYSQTVTLYLKAAQAGDVNVMPNLGLMYATGKGVPQNPNEAMKWYSKSAAANNELGMYNFGVLYAEGQGVAKDYAKAGDWFRKALARARETDNQKIIYAAGHNLETIAAHRTTRRTTDTCNNSYIQKHSRSFGDLFARSLICGMRQEHGARQRPVNACNAACSQRCDNGGEPDRICYNNCISSCW